MATGLMDRKRVRLLWLVAADLATDSCFAFAAMAQAQEEPPPGAVGGFPNGGFLGGNPFGPSPEEREKAKRDADDWSYRPRNADKYLRAALSCFRDEKFE